MSQHGDAPDDEAVAIRNVVKVFGAGQKAVTALNGVSLTIGDNEFFTLLGPSGCGKTTLLRLIAGFEQTTAGEIVLFGEHIEGLLPFERPVNTVFQHYSLFPHMTVAENVGFSLRRLKRPESEIAERVSEMLRLVKLEQFGDRKPSQLSGGQQQRVALARALAPSPKVLLLDEPLSALDLKLRQAMRAELKQLQKESGITFIFVTHDQDEALSMSDRVAVMSEGEVQQVGAPVEIYEYPVNRFVADFIGNANFMDGRITSIEDSLAVCTVGDGLRLKAENSAGHGIGDSVTLFLRPEKMSLLEPEAGRQGLSGRIEQIVYLGNSSAYRIATEGGLDLLVEARNREDGALPFGVGDSALVHFSPRALRVLAR